jgi:hypothetical protein
MGGDDAAEGVDPLPALSDSSLSEVVEPPGHSGDGGARAAPQHLISQHEDMEVETTETPPTGRP